MLCVTFVSAANVQMRCVVRRFYHSLASDTLLTPKLAKDIVASLAALLKAVPRDQPEATVVRVPLMRAFSLLQPATYATVYVSSLTVLCV